MLDPDIEKKIKAFQDQLLAQSPSHIKKLGKILRRRSLFSLHKFLVEHGYAGKVPAGDLTFFMDYLITQRIDLKDMHEAAREELRKRTLRDQPPEAKTADYRKYVEQSTEPAHCRDCQWFMQAPPGEKKSCVQLGSAKGCDEPCYGFTKKRLS